MSRFDAELVRLADERVTEALPGRPTRAGTLVTLDTGSLACTVRIDGSTTATPMKLLGHVRAQPGERVALAQFEGDWRVVGALAAPAATPSLEAATVTPAQTVAASTVTAVSWQTPSENVGSFGKPNATDFTVPAAGVYTATFQGLFANGQTGRAFAQVLLAGRTFRCPCGGFSESGFSATGQRRLAVGDVIRAEVFAATATSMQPSTLVIYQIGS